MDQLTVLKACAWWVALVVVMAATRAAAAPASAQLDLGRFIDRAVSHVNACHGLAVGVKRGGARAERFYGTTGEHGRPNADTEFEIGSITKTFTATMLAYEVQKGAMHLDDPLANYAPPRVTVPRFNGRQILLAHLAEHTSGLPRTMPAQGEHTPPQAAWAFLNDYRLTRPPGQRYAYSNLAYGLLGLAIVRTEGRRLDPLYAQVIDQPLGMPDTAIELSPAQHARLAQGYHPNGRPAPENPPRFPALNGAGAMRSTLKDMMRYLDFELGEIDVPLKALLPALHQPRHAAGPRGSVGLGWQMHNLANGVEVIAKDGAMPGYSTFIVFAPSSKTGAVILANQARCPVPKIGAELINGLNGLTEPPSEFPPAESGDD